VVADFARYLGALLTRIAAVPAAMLPARLWPTLDAHLPVSESALPAALLTVLAGAAIGIPGFFEYASEQASMSTDAMLEAARVQAARPAGEDSVTTSMPVAMTALSVFGFLLLTFKGWSTMYLMGTGVFRLLGVTADDPQGDPILSLIDSALFQSFRTAHAQTARWQREAREGPHIPDRLLTGAQIGLPDADLVIVAARRKTGWDPGTILLTDTSAYRVGEIIDCTIEGRLRTLYPLTEHNDLEVFRRAVRYDMPPLG
jgi:hypothetical protein